MSEEPQSKRKSFNIVYEEPPKAEKKGRIVVAYGGTIDSFVSNGKPYGRIEIEKGKKLSTISAGLKSAIERMNKTNEIKVITRKSKLYLISRDYSNEKKWKWETKRKKKEE